MFALFAFRQLLQMFPTKLSLDKTMLLILL